MKISMHWIIGSAFYSGKISLWDYIFRILLDVLSEYNNFLGKISGWIFVPRQGLLLKHEIVAGRDFCLLTTIFPALGIGCVIE